MGFLRIKHKTLKIVQSYYKKCTYASKMSFFSKMIDKSISFCFIAYSKLAC